MLFFLLVAAAGAVCHIPSERYCQADFVIDPQTVPLFETELLGPPPIHVPARIVDGKPHYEVWAVEHRQQILPAGFPETPLFVYAGNAKDASTGESLGFVASSPAATFMATQFQETFVTWINNLTCPAMFPVDPMLHWANPNNASRPSGFPTDWPASVEEQNALRPPNYPWFGLEYQQNVPISVHLHGAEVAGSSDGNPDHWYTAAGQHGPLYKPVMPPPSPNATVSQYHNGDLPSSLWYHDHALGVTRLNVGAGMVGMYVMNNPTDPIAPLLPSGKYDWPLVFQDRIFNADGSICVPMRNFRPGQRVVAPYWTPTYIGNIMLVNGKAWPRIPVDRGQYLFRLLDGCNTRYLNLTIELTDEPGTPLHEFTLVGLDGSYAQRAVQRRSLLIAPAQRHSILVDFSSFAPGTRLTVRNSAVAPYPGGGAPTGNMTFVLQFVVGEAVGFAPRNLPDPLMPSLVPFPSIQADQPPRYVPLSNVRQRNAQVEELLVNGQKYVAPPLIFENSQTYDIGYVNLLNGHHPMHIHLASQQILWRQPINKTAYESDWMALNGGGLPPYPEPKELDPTPYFIGERQPPTEVEIGWVDVIDAYANSVTMLRIEISPIADLGTPFDEFDATEETGYVMHCHLLEHEDNEMMIRFLVRSQGCKAIYEPSCNTTLKTPCCTPGQKCRRHASSPDCNNVVAGEDKYLCVPE